MEEELPYGVLRELAARFQEGSPEEHSIKMILAEVENLKDQLAEIAAIAGGR